MHLSDRRHFFGCTLSFLCPFLLFLHLRPPFRLLQFYIEKMFFLLQKIVGVGLKLSLLPQWLFPCIHTEEKSFFGCHFQRFVACFFSNKLKEQVAYFGQLVSCLLNKYCLWETVNFLYVDNWSDVTKGKFIMKNSSLKCSLCFRLFLWWTQE